MYSFTNDGRNVQWFRLRCEWSCAAVAIVIALGVAQTFAQSREVVKLSSSDVTADDRFGFAVSVDGSTAVVGAWGVDCVGRTNCGAAYVYRLDGAGWTEEAKLFGSVGTNVDFFGRVVSVDGNTVVVGAPLAGCASGVACGAVYVFRFDGTNWVEEAKLTASDGANLDQFGRSLSVSGDTILVGSPSSDCVLGDACGSVYVFRFDGASWVQEVKLTPSDAVEGDAFGAAVSISGDVGVVGAALVDCNSTIDCGAAYVFRFDGTNWVEETKLTATDGAGLDQFGFSVSVNGDAIVVGAHQDDVPFFGNSGSVYIYRFDGISWAAEANLRASDPASNSAFAETVSLSGDALVVGSRWQDCAAGNDCGSAYFYLFDGTTWTEKSKMTASDADAEDRFGGSVSVSGDMAIVGANFDDCAAGDLCGSVYLFRLLLTCGDGILDPGEACDDGNTDDTDLCLSTCEINPSPIPTVSEWGLVGMALLVLTAGTLISARRRRVST